jgi:hypothetical protein
VPAVRERLPGRLAQEVVQGRGVPPPSEDGDLAKVTRNAEGTRAPSRAGCGASGS